MDWKRRLSNEGVGPILQTAVLCSVQYERGNTVLIRED